MQFHDPIGRISEKPKTYAHGITDNPLLFTGEYYYLLSRCRQLTEDEVLHCAKTRIDSMLKYGLYRRHSSGFQREFKVPYNQISHDEYVGILLLAHCQKITWLIANDICNYGKRNNWQYNDLAPDVSFWREFKKHSVKQIKDLIEYHRVKKSNAHDTNQVDATFHNQSVVSLNFQRTPRDIAFYELLGRNKTSLFNLIFMCLAHVFTTRRDIYDSKRGGTILLALFRIELLNDHHKDNWFLKMTRKFFHQRLRKKYGKNYLTVIAKHYFDLKDDEGNHHPIIEMIDVLTYR